jgi:shikimate kinase
VTDHFAVRPRIIYLVGFMGAGKTSVGLRLAELLDWSFVDLDEEIEKGQGESIRSIFKIRGEARFRELERGELDKVSAGTRTVVALGGGTFCSDENRRIISSTGVSIWLDTPVETLYRRCAGDESRPLFTSRSEMEQLLEKRRPFYEQSSLRIEAGDLSVDALARQIFKQLEESFP